MLYYTVTGVNYKQALPGCFFFFLVGVGGWGGGVGVWRGICQLSFQGLFIYTERW